jgi:hypothetical protein
MPPNHEAAAGPGRSEHRNVDILIPVARQRESPAGPNVPCERRTDPAEPPPPTSPRRQPWHSATAKQVRAPGGMRRSFRTLRLCAIPGVSPRAGMRCPVGALRTPHNPQSPHRLHVPTASASPRPQRHHHKTPGQRRLFSSTATIKPAPLRDRLPSNPAAAGSGRSEHRNVDILIPLARQRESPAGPNVPCERRTDPAEPPPPTSPRRQPQHSATATPCGAPPSRPTCLTSPLALGPASQSLSCDSRT